MRANCPFEILGVAKQPGLTEVLCGQVEFKKAVHKTPLDDLFLMGCGLASDQESLEMPFELLTPMMEERMNEFGYMVFDLPLADHLTACQSITPHLDGVILTVESNQIDQQQVNRFRSQIESVGTDVIGVVINKART